jgi:hypothetical protein
MLSLGHVKCLSFIFGQAGKELEASSFLAGSEFLNDIHLYLVPSRERARSQTDYKEGLRERVTKQSPKVSH